LPHLSFEKTTSVQVDVAQLFTAVKQPPQPTTLITLSHSQPYHTHQESYSSASNFSHNQ